MQSIEEIKEPVPSDLWVSLKSGNYKEDNNKYLSNSFIRKVKNLMNKRKSDSVSKTEHIDGLVMQIFGDIFNVYQAYLLSVVKLKKGTNNREANKNEKNVKINVQTISSGRLRFNVGNFLKDKNVIFFVSDVEREVDQMLLAFGKSKNNKIQKKQEDKNSQSSIKDKLSKIFFKKESCNLISQCDVNENNKLKSIEVFKYFIKQVAISLRDFSSSENQLILNVCDVISLIHDFLDPSCYVDASEWLEKQINGNDSEDRIFDFDTPNNNSRVSWNFFCEVMNKFEKKREFRMPLTSFSKFIKKDNDINWILDMEKFKHLLDDYVYHTVISDKTIFKTTKCYGNKWPSPDLPKLKSDREGFVRQVLESNCSFNISSTDELQDVINFVLYYLNPLHKECKRDKLISAISDLKNSSQESCTHSVLCSLFEKVNLANANIDQQFIKSLEAVGGYGVISALVNKSGFEFKEKTMGDSVVPLGARSTDLVGEIMLQKGENGFANTFKSKLNQFTNLFNNEQKKQKKLTLQSQKNFDRDITENIPKVIEEMFNKFESMIQKQGTQSLDSWNEFVGTLKAFYKNNFEPVYFNSYGSGANINYDVFMKLVKIALYCDQKLCLSSSMEKSETIIASMKHINFVNMSIFQQQRVNLSVKLDDINQKGKKTNEILENQIEFKDSLLLYVYANCLNQNKNCLLENTNNVIAIDNLSRHWLSKSLFDKTFDLKYIAPYIGAAENIDIGKIYRHIIEFLNSAYSCKDSKNFDNERRIIIENGDLIGIIIEALKCCICANNVVDGNKSLSVDSVLEFCFRGLLLSKDQNKEDKIVLSNNICTFYIRILNLLDNNNSFFQESDLAMALIYKVERCLYDSISESGLECIDVFTQVFCQINTIKQNIKNRIAETEVNLPTYEEIEKMKETTKNDLRQNSEISNSVVDNIVLSENANHAVPDGNANIADIQHQQNFVSSIEKLKDDRNKAYLSMIQKFCDNENVFKKFIENARREAEKNFNIDLKLGSELDKNIVIMKHKIKKFISLFSLPNEDQFDKMHAQEIMRLVKNFIGKLISNSQLPQAETGREQCESVMTQYFISDYSITFVWEDFFKNELVSEIKKRSDIIENRNNHRETDNRHYSAVLEKIFSRDLADNLYNTEYISASDFITIYNTTLENKQTYKSYDSLFKQAHSMEQASIQNMAELVFFDFRSSEQLQKLFDVLSIIYRNENQNPFRQSNFPISMDTFFPILKNIIIDCYDNYPDVVHHIFSLDIFANNSLSISNLQIICDLVEIKRQNEHRLIQTNQNSDSFLDNVMKLSRINNSDTVGSKLSLRTFVRCLKLSGDRIVLQSRFDLAIAEYNLVFDCREFLCVVCSEPNVAYESFSKYCSFSFPHLSSIFCDTGENVNPYADNNRCDIKNPFLPLGTEFNEAQENGLSDSKFVLKDKLALLSLLWKTWRGRTLTEMNNNFANVDVRKLSSCYMNYLNFVLYYAKEFICSCKDQTEDIKKIVSFVQKVIGSFVNEDAQEILNHCKQPNINVGSNEKLDFILNMMEILSQYNHSFANYGFTGDYGSYLDASGLIKIMSTLIRVVHGSWKNKLEKCFVWLNVMMIPNSLNEENTIEIMKLLLSEDENDNPDSDADNIEGILFDLLRKLIDLARPEFKLNVVINFLDCSEKHCSSNLVEQLLQELQGQEFEFETIDQLILKLDKSKLENATIAGYILDMANKDDKLRIFDKLLERAQNFDIPLYKSFSHLLQIPTWSRSTIHFDTICPLFAKFSGDSDTPKESLIDLCLLVPRQDIKNVDDVLRYIQTFLKTSGLKFESGQFYRLLSLLFNERGICIDYENMLDVISVLEKKQNVPDECLIGVLKHCSAESDKNCQNNLFSSFVNFDDNTLGIQRYNIVELLCKIIEVTEEPFEIDVKDINLQIMKIMANNNQALKNKQKTNVETLSNVLDCLVEKKIALSLGQLEYIFSYYFDNDTANNQEFSIKSPLPLSLSNNLHQNLLNKFISILKPDENNFAHKFNQEQKNNKSARNNCAITLESFFKKYFGVEKLPKAEVLDVIKKVDFSKVKKPNEPIKKLITELWNFSEPFETGEVKKALSIEKFISDKVEWVRIDKDLGNIYFNEQIRSICNQINNRNLNLCKEDYTEIQNKLSSLREYFGINGSNSKTTCKLDKENEKSETAKELFRFVNDSSDKNTDVTEVMLYLYLTHKKIQIQDKSNSEISDIIREVIGFGFIENTENKIGYFENILDNLLIDENKQIQKVSFNSSDSAFYLIMEGLKDNSVRYRDLVEFVGRYFSKQEIQNNIVICLFKQSWKYIKRAFSNESAADDKVLQIDDFEDKDRLKDISFDQKDVLFMSRKIKSRFLDFTTDNNKTAAERFLSNCRFDSNCDKRFSSGDMSTILGKCKFRNADALIDFFNSHWDAGVSPTREQSVAWIGSAGLSDKNQEEINKFWRHIQELYLLNEIYKLSNGNVENDFFNPDFKGKFEEYGKVANELMSSGSINPRDAKELYNQIGYKYKDANHEASITLLFNVMLLPYEIWVLNFVLFSASNLLLVLLVIAGVMGTILLNALTVLVLCLNLALTAYFGIKTGKAVSFNCKKVVFEPEKTWFQNLCTKLLRRIFYKPNFNRGNFSVPGYTAQLNRGCQIANRQHEYEVPVIEKNVEHSSISEQVKFVE